METKLLKIKGTEEFAIIDAEDYERVKSFDLLVEYRGKNRKRYIACRIGKSNEKYIRLTHIILGFADSDKKIQVRYLNKNTFDLRKSNLQSLDKSGKSIVSVTSGLRIIFHKGCNGKQKPSPWSVHIYLREIKKSIYIGKYASEQIAKTVIRYIEENNIPISHEEEVKISKPVIRAWAFENGLTNHLLENRNRQVCKVGDETIENGYVLVKTEKGWRRKHHLIWEEAGNVIPENHHLFFKDGNKQNFDLDNLEAVLRSETGKRTTLLKYPEELRPTVELIWQLKSEVKKQQNDKPKGKISSPNVNLYHCPNSYSKNPWRVYIYCPSASSLSRTHTFYIGQYESRKIAQEIVDFIKASNFSIKSREDIENIKSLVRNFVIEKGYRKPYQFRNKSIIN